MNGSYRGPYLYRIDLPDEKVLIEFARCNNVTGFVLDEVVYEFVGARSIKRQNASEQDQMKCINTAKVLFKWRMIVFKHPDF